MIPLMVVSIMLPRGIKGLGRFIASPAKNDCPECGANEPITTPEGFTVCSSCGIEYPDSQTYVCSDALARGGGIIQSHMILTSHTRRTIGTRGEQATLPRALAWGDKISVTYEQEVLMRGYFEIRKALAQLDLEGRDSLFDAAMAGFAHAYRRTPKGGRCHNVHLLALVATYQALRVARIPVPRKEFLTKCLDHARFPEQVFNVVLKDTTGFFPSIDRCAMIPHEVSAILSRLACPKTLAEIAAKITRHYTNVFQSPKPAVAAAAIIGITVIATNTRKQFPLSVIAKHAGIAASAMIRCMSEACRRRKHPIEGSIVQASECLHSLFIPSTETSQEVTNPTTCTCKIMPEAKMATPVRIDCDKDVKPVSENICITPTKANHRGTILKRLSIKGFIQSYAHTRWQVEEGGGGLSSYNSQVKKNLSTKYIHLPFPEGPPDGFS